VDCILLGAAAQLPVTTKAMPSLQAGFGLFAMLTCQCCSNYGALTLLSCSINHPAVGAARQRCCQ